MELVNAAQGYVALALGIGLLVLEIGAFVDVLRRPANAFAQTGNQTKVVWLVITGICLAIGFVFLQNPFNLFGILAGVGAAVYYLRVYPEIKHIRGGGKRGW